MVVVFPLAFLAAISGVMPEPAIKSIKYWKRNPGGAARSPCRFEFGKLGLWEAWYNFPPERDWLPPDVFERVRAVRIIFQTYWYIQKPNETIDNKIRKLPGVAPLVVPPEAEVPPEADFCSPTASTLTESEDEAQLIEVSDDEVEMLISMMDTPLLW